MELEAARFFNYSCRVVNRTTTEHLPSTSTPDYTEHGVWTTRKITTLVIATNYDKPVTMGTKVSTTGKAIDELPTSQPTDLNTPLSNPNEVTFSLSESNTDQESSSPTSSSAVISSSVTPSGTLVLNNSQIPDESTGVQTAYVMSWQLAVSWALFIVLFVMIVLAVGYVTKRQRGRLECKNAKKKKEQRILAEAYGFPEVRLRSRSGELNLSDVRRSIEAGSYNVRSGTITYGESFYM